jgi:transposase
MHPRSSMSADQRVACIDLFEEGFGYRAVSSRLGVRVKAVKVLEARFKIWGRAALESKPTRQVYSFEFKMAVVRQFLDGDGTAPDLAREHQLNSPHQVRRWVQLYREQGEEGLRLKPRGRPKKISARPESPELSELDQLRRENQRLAAEVAYLKKVRALKNQPRS